MIVPRYWAEARVQRPASKGRKIGQLTLRRYGWSNVGQADAQTMADARVADAMAKADTGERPESRDPKVPYNGADGVPIREQIVEEHGETVITRNGYGAMCLNTPDVLFADIDDPPGAGPGWAASAMAMVASIVSAFTGGARRTPTHSGLVGNRVEAFVAAHPGWVARLYRTPAGHRLLVTHRTFQTTDPEVAECFTSLMVDPAYARMCRHQQCFRARLTPKPWRMGQAPYKRPRPEIWPVTPERLVERTAWLASYDAQSKAFAACRFLKEYGSGRLSSEAARVRDLHDDRCGALGLLPLA